MASGQPQPLYAESKQRLADRIQGNVNSCGSIARQIIRGSKSADLLQTSIKNTAQQDYTMENTEINLKKAENLNNQIKLQLMKMRLPELDETHKKLDLCLAQKLQ